MKLNKVMMATVLALGVSSTAFAADQGHGKVTFTGSIIDAPCSISPEDADQVVNLGQVSNVALKNMGKSIPRDFDIKLEQCDITTLKTVTATFSGVASSVNPALLALSGLASGAGVALTHAGAPVKLGQATSPATLGAGNNNIRFSAYLQGESASAAVVPGDFTAVANWTLAYQ